MTHQRTFFGYDKKTSERLEKMPIRAVKCAACKFLRPATSPAVQETGMMVCGYFDRAPFLPDDLSYSFNEGSRLVSAKRLFGPHTEGPPFDCPCFEEKETDQ